MVSCWATKVRKRNRCRGESPQHRTLCCQPHLCIAARICSPQSHTPQGTGEPPSTTGHSYRLLRAMCVPHGLRVAGKERMEYSSLETGCNTAPKLMVRLILKIQVTQEMWDLGVLSETPKSNQPCATQMTE